MLYITRHKLHSLALNLIINSIVFIFFTLPYIFIQAILCYPIQMYVLCCLQAFVCFTCGICVMYTTSLLALGQYVKLFCHSSKIHQMFKQKNNYTIPVVCWILSLFWSIPPFINIKPGFMREGMGFDCGINWKSSDFSSLLYIILIFIFIYILPLFCLLYTDICITRTLRKLIYRRQSIIPESATKIPIHMRHQLIDTMTVAESNRLQRLKVDRRFAQATMITVLHYLLIWTPYSICAVIQIMTAMKFIQFKLPPMVITTAALVAKLGVTGQSCVYFYTVRSLNN